MPDAQPVDEAVEATVVVEPPAESSRQAKLREARMGSGKPDHGPGSHVKWDEPDNDPSNRIPYSLDPDGKKNRARIK